MQGVKKSVGRVVKRVFRYQTMRVTTKAKTTPSTVRARVRIVLLLQCACGKISLAPI
jgi:hypothetical protein